MSEDSGPGARGSAAVRRGLRPIVRALAVVLRPIGRALAVVLALIDRLMRPFAGLYNRTLGRLWGEVTGLQFLLLVLGLGIILLVPHLLESFLGSDASPYLRTFTIAAIWAVFAMGWDIQSGYTGYVSFGHSVLSGAAGYTTGLLLLHGEIVSQYLPISESPWILYTILLSILVTLIVGLLIALPALRLRGPYFSLITFVAVLLSTRVVLGFNEWTEGETGFNLVNAAGLDPEYPWEYAFNPDPDPVSVGLELFDFQVFSMDFNFKYLVISSVMVAVIIVLVTIARSNVGLILTAIRENEPAVAAAGISPTKFKIWSFVISSIPMGIGGVMLAHHSENIQPVTFLAVDNSIEMIAMAVVGGMASIVGPLFGAFALILSREHLLGIVIDWLPFVGHDVELLLLWTLVIAVLVFARRGIFRWLWHAVGSIGGEP